MSGDNVRIAHVDEIAAEPEEPGDERQWNQLIVDEHHEVEADDPEAENRELYMVLRGRAEFTLGGEQVDAPAGTLVYLYDPAIVRSAVAREDGTAVLAVGGPAGRPFAVSSWEADWAASRGSTV